MPDAARFGPRGVGGWLAGSDSSSATPVDLARENAVEGAARADRLPIACYQAENAADPELRAALQTIAHEEIAHARSSPPSRTGRKLADAAAQAEVAAARKGPSLSFRPSFHTTPHPRCRDAGRLAAPS